MYETTDNDMKVLDDLQPNDLMSMSGCKMLLLAKNGAAPIPPDNIPTDLVAANCVPSGFTV